MVTPAPSRRRVFLIATYRRTSGSDLIVNSPSAAAAAAMVIAVTYPSTRITFLLFLSGSAARDLDRHFAARRDLTVAGVKLKCARISRKDAFPPAGPGFTIGVTTREVTSVALPPGTGNLTGLVENGRGFPYHVWLMNYPILGGATLDFRDAAGQVRQVTLGDVAGGLHSRPAAGSRFCVPRAGR
jgi:hypothetical protein